MKNAVFSVRPAEDGKTLQDFLAIRLQLSRNRAKALVDERNVLVNLKRVWMARHALRTGDQVEVLASRHPPEASRPIPILFEQADYLIVDKPAGLVTNGPDSVEQRLRDQLAAPELLAAHRLDRDTSGCLLCARNRSAFDAVVRLFRAQRVRKSYHAIVVGRLDVDERAITAPIDGDHASTHLRVRSATREASHLRLTIETGRTHQIRRHLALIRHPVAGDRQYAVGRELTRRLLAVPRQMLHASSIEFDHPVTRQHLFASAPLPADFRQCLKQFGLA